jgi:glycosyltransferase involved in cell wall biosynthesis
MTKVIVVAYDLNPRIGSEAGAAYIWTNILSKSYDVVAYTREAHRLDLSKSGLNVKTKYFMVASNLSKIFRKLRLYNLDNNLFISQLRDELKRDVIAKDVIIHFLTPSGIHSYNSLANELGVPYIVGPIGGYLKLPPGFEEYRSFSTKLKELFYSILVTRKAWRSYFNGASVIICGTDLVKAHLPQNAQSKAHIIHDTVVDVDFFSPITRKPKAGDEIKITFTGRLEPFKGVYLLLNAFKIVANEYPNATLIFAGIGSAMSSLKKQVQQHKLLDRVKILGRIDRVTLRDLLLDSDIYCLPTLKEPGGTALLEAMACELPVITSNYGGPAISVNNDCGILIETSSPQQYINDLVVAISNLITNPERRTSLGKNGRARVVQNYSPKALAGAIDNLYASTILSTSR